MPPLVRSQFAELFLKQLQTFRELRFLCDVRLIADGRTEFPAHRLVLAASSPFFQELFQAKKDAQDVTTVHLRNCNPDCVLVVLQFLYSGELNLRECDPAKVLNVARACKIAALEVMLAPYATTANGSSYSTPEIPAKVESPQLEAPKRKGREAKVELPGSFEFPPKFCQFHTLMGIPCNCTTDKMAVDPNALRMLLSNAAMAAVDQHAQQMAKYPRPILPAIFNYPTAAQSNYPTSPPKEQRSSVADSIEADNEPPSPLKDFDPNGQLPVDDRDGWCRNKKYIKKTATGYQCTICKKTYGRYNSVSYHVTIYHRNPPIQCDQNGCTFSTREARYIHFHKYYRHDIALPTNIDLQSRRCPNCKHVAKSPAMLEKHISRHGNVRAVDKMYQCEICKKEFGSRQNLTQHSLSHKGELELACDKCSYRGSTATNLQQHKLFKHSGDLWLNKFQCDECHYSSPSDSKLRAHKNQAHKGPIDDKLIIDDRLSLSDVESADEAFDSGQESFDAPSMVTALRPSTSVEDLLSDRQSVINAVSSSSSSMASA